MIRFFEQGSDAIAVSAADQRMVKATDKGQDTPQVPDTNGEIPGAGNTNDKDLADNTQKNPEEVEKRRALIQPVQRPEIIIPRRCGVFCFFSVVEQL